MMHNSRLDIHLIAKFPQFRLAQSASRYVNQDGKAEHCITLYATDRNVQPVGRCTWDTMQLFIEAGLWLSVHAQRVEGQDWGYDRWYKLEQETRR